jgi:thiol:disulfide interchange protein DsbD
MAARLRRLTPVLGLLLYSQAPAADLWSRPQASTLLSADEAFRLLPVTRKGDTLRLEWDVAPGYYLYRDRIEATETAPDAGHRLRLQLPPGAPHHDAHFGDVRVYRSGFVATAPGAAKATRIRVRYQGCADIGVCLPPVEQDVAVSDGTAP